MVYDPTRSDARIPLDTGFLGALTKAHIENRQGPFKVTFERKQDVYGDEKLAMRVFLSPNNAPVLAYDVVDNLRYCSQERYEDSILRIIKQVFSALDIPLREIPLNLHGNSEVTTFVYKWRLEHGI